MYETLEAEIGILISSGKVAIRFEGRAPYFEALFPSKQRSDHVTPIIV